MVTAIRLVRLGVPGQERPYVIDSRDDLFDLSTLTSDIDGDFLAHGGIERTRGALERRELPPAGSWLDNNRRVAPPVARPGKVVCIGLNYRDHAAETNAALPAEPVMFLKDASTVVGAYDDVLVPRLSVKTDWEVELAVVIGSEARYLKTDADALVCIAGYAVSHDVSEREFQLERGGQWDKGKSCETFNPLGPWLVPADQIADPQQLRLRASVNDVVRQDGTTAEMLFGVAYVVRYLSQFLVLRPGDVVNTGTPAGVALGQPEPKPYLRAGDVVELSIDGLGTQRQRMVQA